MSTFPREERDNPLRLTMYGDIDPAPRKDWTVFNFIGAGELSCIPAAPATAKSAIAGDIGCHVAAGREWFGRRVSPGGVLYVAAERSAVVKRRFAAFRKYHQLDGLALGVVSGSVDLRSSAQSATDILDLAKRLADAKEADVTLIILDTVSRCMAGGDENSSKDMGMFLRNVEHVQASGAHVLMLHHIPADGQQRPRGHGALLAACDTTFHIEQSGNVRTLTVKKSNDADEGERVAFTLESVELHYDEETGVTTGAPVVVPFDGPVPKAAASRKLSGKHRLALDALNDLAAKNGKPPPAIYSLPYGIQTVSCDEWKTELFARGILDRDSTNPRQDFRRVKTTLQSRHLAAEREGLIWPVQP